MKLLRFGVTGADLSKMYDRIKSESENISRFSEKIPEYCKTVIILIGVNARYTALSTVNLLFEGPIHTSILMV